MRVTANRRAASGNDGHGQLPEPEGKPMPADAATTIDSVLIERSLATPVEFAAIFDRHAEAINRYLARRIGPAVAEDLTAETFLVAFARRHRYDGTQPDARPWLYGIATNLIRRHRRDEVRQFRAYARTGIDPVVNLADDVVSRVASASAARRVALVVARLPARERDVVLLVAWQELGYADVARALDIPIGTVRSRLHSARKRLRAALTDLDPEQDLS
jgi:RNA polymerase sigma-70 factor (ECF subfamily)